MSVHLHAWGTLLEYFLSAEKRKNLQKFHQIFTDHNLRKNSKIVATKIRTGWILWDGWNGWLREAPKIKMLCLMLDAHLHCNFSFGCFRVQPSVGYAGHKRLIQSGRPRLGTRTQEGGHHQKTGRHGHKRRHHGHAVSTRFFLFNAPNFLCIEWTRDGGRFIV